MLEKFFTPAQQVVARVPTKTIDTCVFEGSVKEKMKSCMDDSFFSNALYIASPALHEQIKLYLNENDATEKRTKKIEHAFMRYLNRMSTRCTPFGMFAAVGTMEIAENGDKNIVHDTSGQYLDVKLDALVLENISNRLLNEPYIRTRLQYKVNETCLFDGEDVKYINYYFLHGKRIHEVVKIDRNEYLYEVLKSGGNWVNYKEIIGTLQAYDEDLEMDDIVAFIDELIETHILITEIAPSIAGMPYQDHFMEVLERLLIKDIEGEARDLVGRVTSIFKKTRAVNKDVSLMGFVEWLIDEFTSLDIQFDPQRILHIDTYHQFEQVKIDQSIINSVMRGIEVASHFTLSSSSATVEAFKKVMEATYNEAPVSLLTVLDADMGIGYPANKLKIGANNQLLNEITALNPPAKPYTEMRWYEQHYSFWLQKYVDCIKAQEREIVLTDADLKSFQSVIPQLPDTFNAHFSIISAKNLQQNEFDHYVQFNGWAGITATNMLARFANAHPGIQKICEEAAMVEERALGEHEVMAEISHVSDAGLVNILARPLLRKYELPYLVNSQLPGERAIYPGDLQVYVKNDKVLLYAEKIQKFVKPVLTSAHNYTMSEHPVYKFLCDIQRQNTVDGVHIHLGTWVDKLDYFPRVRYQNVVLIPASWEFKESYFEPFFKQQITITEMRERLMHKLQHIRYFMVKEGDNEMYVDVTCEHHWEMFFAYIKSMKKIIIKESLFDPSQGMTNDFILPFYKKEAAQTSSKGNSAQLIRALQSATQENTQRSFYPCDSWTYFKIYCNPSQFDQLLSKEWPQLLQKWNTDYQYEPQFFFIRYFDTAHHLRFRLFNPPVEHFGNIVKDVFAHFSALPFVHNIQMEKYARELERYHPADFDVLEKVFCKDAEIVQYFLQENWQLPDFVRLQFALKNVRHYLLSFGFSLNEILQFCEVARDNFAVEFNMDLILKKQLSKNFREHREAYEATVVGLPNELPWIERGEYCKSLRLEVLTTQKRNEIIWSIVHMHVNRLFNFNQRFYELIVYDYMERIARIEVGKARSGMNIASMNQ
ncbi:thiopeptide-type bacteriocin biosynthesis protein [Chitinophaga skermanii]|uniref:Thiopeptide-type bacteriocin biosynthesis protein n=1 Tax=Chitinophaga skermanii TaxID=331697 RepID=A0A327R379_9BACT|nr:lantibiotic dehydratase [Chitinophaga skermanii]RAJ11170.1 thiopeptide-type bacteriocin biosynthesis protein [Chitinophaga skermanii]